MLTFPPTLLTTPPRTPDLLTGIAPPDVQCVETAADLLTDLSAAEAAAVAGAGPARRAEFVAVRACARAALAALGVPAAPVAPGPDGDPAWPGGVVGSMTHCAGYRAAAVARAVDVFALGVDAEPDEPVPEPVFAALTTGAERAALPPYADVRWDRLLVCAKEATFKAWFPRERRWPPATAIDVRLHDDGSFESRVLGGAPLAGRWASGGGLLVALVVSPLVT